METYGIALAILLSPLGSLIATAVLPKYALPAAAVNLAVIAALLALGRWRIPVWRKATGLALFPREYPALAAKGLVAMVSAGNGRMTALAAARHHGKLGLKHLWLISSQESRADAEWLQAEMARDLPAVDVKLRPSLESAFSVEEMKAEVEHVRSLALKQLHLREDELVCDFTGMTKHASVGMVLACLPAVARLEYVSPQTSDERQRGVTPKPPVEVHIAYRLEEDAAEQ